jgi:uncharacterized membrane protein YidH (DUF202 family)
MEATLRSLFRVGNVLIYTEISLTILQFGVVVYDGLTHGNRPAMHFETRSGQLSALGSVAVNFQTTYPGILLCGFGVFLLAAGFWAQPRGRAALLVPL